MGNKNSSSRKHKNNENDDDDVEGFFLEDWEILNDASKFKDFDKNKNNISLNSELLISQVKTDPFKDYQEPPLLHAYKKFKSGTYNLNDKNHTPDVKRKGEDLFSNEEFIKMWKNSKYYYK